MRKDVARQVVTALMAAATFVVNLLANALPFNNLTTGQISDQFEVYFVPAGYVFSIWGLIYLGWITVATVANVTSLLDYRGWNGWGISPQIWAVIMLIAGGAIASAVSVTRGDIAYFAVIVWAFVGIAVKHAGTPAVTITAWVVAAIVAMTLVIGVPRTKLRLKRV